MAGGALSYILLSWRLFEYWSHSLGHSGHSRAIRDRPMPTPDDRSGRILSVFPRGGTPRTPPDITLIVLRFNSTFVDIQYSGWQINVIPSCKTGIPVLLDPRLRGSSPSRTSTAPDILTPMQSMGVVLGGAAMASLSSRCFTDNENPRREGWDRFGRSSQVKGRVPQGLRGSSRTERDRSAERSLPPFLEIQDRVLSSQRRPDTCSNTVRPTVFTCEAGKKSSIAPPVAGAGKLSSRAFRGPNGDLLARRGSREIASAAKRAGTRLKKA